MVVEVGLGHITVGGPGDLWCWGLWTLLGDQLWGQSGSLDAPDTPVSGAEASQPHGGAWIAVGPGSSPQLADHSCTTAQHSAAVVSGI